MHKTATSIDETTASAEISDGRITMSATDRDATLTVRVPEHVPLSESEPVAQLVIHGEEFKGEVELASADARDLVDALDGDHDE